LFPFAYRPPRSRLGLKFFYFFVQQFLLQNVSTLSRPYWGGAQQHTTRLSNTAFSKMEYGAEGFGDCLSPTTAQNM
jgi:hypothetical protein